ncbi:hypothetical protein [Gayadomonas joobiniege]|uniref:hypothetical protein n=1 Tax=Gayadomonas joobiniege TaxID=1234606 RepID=UPI000373032E|nr:hypothetical protein [Gayadomonas joobiniege]
MDAAISTAVEDAVDNPELVVEGAKILGDTIKDKVTPKTVGHMIGRTVTGILLSPLGGLALVGDTTKSIETNVEKGAAKLNEVVIEALYGEE